MATSGHMTHSMLCREREKNSVLGQKGINTKMLMGIKYNNRANTEREDMPLHRPFELFAFCNNRKKERKSMALSKESKVLHIVSVY